jgi:hypothetical protein
VSSASTCSIGTGPTEDSEYELSEGFVCQVVSRFILSSLNERESLSSNFKVVGRARDFSCRELGRCGEGGLEIIEGEDGDRLTGARE